MRIRTWQKESAVMAIILASVTALHPTLAEFVCAFAVWVTFMHGQVAEEQGKLSMSSVSCYRWSRRYFVLKELSWIAFFVITQAYSAIIGSVVFLLYPLWRKLYDEHKLVRESKKKQK